MCNLQRQGGKRTKEQRPFMPYANLLALLALGSFPTIWTEPESFPVISLRDGYVHVSTGFDDVGNSFWCGIEKEQFGLTGVGQTTISCCHLGSAL